MKDIQLADGERLDAVNEKITLIQKKDGLTFGTDAFLLAAFIKSQARSRAAELGTGTGIISLLLSARNKLAHISAFEIQKDFVALAERNVMFNGMNDKIKILHKDITKATPSDICGEVDIVFTNPPYMKTESGKRNENDYKYIARHEVCGSIDDFCSASFRLLKHGGKFYVVWRPDRLTDLVCALRKNRLEPKIMTFVHADKDSTPSMVLVSATKGASPGTIITAPLFLYSDKERNKMSDKAKKIYETMSFE